MPRKKPELCMFCEQIPCECNGTAKKKPTKKPARKVAQASAPPPTQPTRGAGEFTLPAPRSERARRRNEKDLPLARAIIALADGGLLSQESRRRFRDTISPAVTGDLERLERLSGEDDTADADRGDDDGYAGAS